MITPRKPGDHPTLFLRIFLSHLLLLTAAFVSAALLFEYLFEPGIKYFLIHRPIVIVPVVMGLVGIAGLLSAWTSGAIAEPLENITDALQSSDPAAGIHLEPGPFATEEIARLAETLTNYQDTLFASETRKRTANARSTSRNILVVTVSSSGVILSANLAAEIFTGKSRSELLYTPFTSVFSTAANDSVEMIDHIRNRIPFSWMPLPATDMKGDHRLVQWTSTPVYDTAGNTTGLLLFGIA